MKKPSLLLLTTILILTACNNNKSKDGKAGSGKDKTTVDTIDIKTSDPEHENEKQLEALQNLSPIPVDQLKALIPGQILGAQRSDVDITSSLGANMASVKYKISDSAELNLDLYDCGGPGGSGVYNMQWLGMLQSREDETNTKIIDLKGGKAILETSTENTETHLTYFSGGRYLVILEGINMNADALKTVASQLNIK